MTAVQPRRALVAAAACAALAPASGALAAPASAATLVANRACYVNANPAAGAPMTLTGAEFVAGDPVAVSGGGVFTTTTVLSDGTFSVVVPAPVLSAPGPGMMKTTLTATDELNGASAASTVVRSANLAVSARPINVRNVRRDRVTFRFSGFTPHRHIFGFYRHRKLVARMRFHKAAGPCGTLRQRALLYPGGHPRHIRYAVAFESRRRYARHAFPRVTGTLSIHHF